MPGTFRRPPVRETGRWLSSAWRFQWPDVRTLLRFSLRFARGPSISLPRHQTLKPNGFSNPVFPAPVAQGAAAGKVTVFHQALRVLRAACPQIDGHHHIGARSFGPLLEFICSHLVGFDAFPGPGRDGAAVSPLARRRPPSDSPKQNSLPDTV